MTSSFCTPLNSSKNKIFDKLSIVIVVEILQNLGIPVEGNQAYPCCDFPKVQLINNSVYGFLVAFE